MLRPLRHRAPVSRNALLAAIHATAKDIGMSDDVRRDMQREQTGRESCKDMTMAELNKVYGALAVLASAMGKADRVYILKKRASRPGRDERQPDELITLEQKAKIWHLAEHVGLEKGLGLTRLCKRVVKQFFPQTREQANKVIEALKNMEQRGWRAHAGQRVGT